MENLHRLDFPIPSPSHARRPLVRRRLTSVRGGVPRRSVRVMAVHECEEELHGYVPGPLLVEPVGSMPGRSASRTDRLTSEERSPPQQNSMGM
jgi:hypothetical protein